MNIKSGGNICIEIKNGSQKGTVTVSLSPKGIRSRLFFILGGLFYQHLNICDNKVELEPTQPSREEKR